MGAIYEIGALCALDEALEGLGRVRLERKNFPGAMEAFLAAAENADLRARSLYNAACAAALEASPPMAPCARPCPARSSPPT